MVKEFKKYEDVEFDLINEVLLSKDSYGVNAWSLADKNKNLNLLEKIFIFGKEILPTKMEQKQLLENALQSVSTPLSKKLLETHLSSLLSIEPIRTMAEQTEQILEPMDVDKAGPSCRRRRRDLGGCGEEREGRVFPYEPWERVVSEESYHSQLHAQLALSLVWGHQESVDNWLRYQRYLGEIVEERLENQSPRERGLLRDHYQQALAFFAENPKNGLLQGVDDDFSPAIGESVFLQNGQHSWVVFNAGERYQLYSPDFNYRQRFQTRGGG